MTSLDRLTDDELRACVVSSDDPLVQCSHSGAVLPGYIICVRAIADTGGLSVEHATSSTIYVRDHFAVPL